MERIRRLNWYQKLLIAILLVMIVVFAVAYQQTIPRKGFRYRGELLVLSEERDRRVFSGQINGKLAVFTVLTDKSVTFVYDNRSYGPYYLKLDPSARPPKEGLQDMLTGIEIYKNDQLLFRGGAMQTSEGKYWLITEDGSITDSGVLPNPNGDYGEWTDGNGIRHDMEEPSLADIAALILGPKIEHKGSWAMWFLGSLLAVAVIAFILYSEEIFRWQLAFLIRRPEEAEPSDWELSSRYLYWTGLTVITAVIFMAGLEM